ncbi:molybdate transport system ATP-binding protein [Litoreibacter ponti]|uniref:Molybdate transport system ATP-binding protein n=1 Tax=Litoreibacter ponti TaxID=1510457 RepID=A0A2T6BLL4_9RHOB|nr:molybdenum ABC transporter ATP-binding protein [Litoreibacter ponti]PTX56942.1 molybdate transport system ATP-binding protein [Litoreibacter ponti]
MSVKVDIRHRFDGFSLETQFASEGGVTALFGPSGSGKTSIINALAGLLTPDEGRIEIGGRVLFDSAAGINVPTHKRRVGYVFQEPRLFPHMTARQNFDYGRPRPLITERHDPAIQALGIRHLLDRDVRGLSGGEAQRVSIARALMSNPSILLLDEPLSALDATRKAEVLPYLQALFSEAQIPVFYVSHAMEEVAQLATDLIVLRDGRVARAGAIGDVLADPEAVSDIGVREAGALLRVTVKTRAAGDGLSELATSNGALFLPQVSAAEGAGLRVRIKASDVILSKDRPDRLSALNILKATVTAVHEGQGPGVAVALRAGEDQLVARITRRSARALGLKPGSACYAVIKSVSVAPADMGPTG